MPHDVYEHLSWLVEGFPMEEVLELVSEEQNSSAFSEDLAAALDVPTTLKSFVVVDGEDELRRIMAEPLEKWRVFLHPTQRKIVQKEYSGSARVLGGAGTGKTVVAMHRAKHLASKCEGQQRILMTTFTANLAADIRENLRKICTLEELRRIEVIHLDAWVNQFLRESGFSAQIGYDDVINPLWERAVLLANIDLPYETTFYEEEWNRIVIAQEALTLEKYVKATRNGRGTRLDRKKRMQVWKVFENYQNLMKENQIRDINTAMYESIVKKMERIGIHCRVFNPFMPGLNVFLNNRDHRKITVIDGKVAFTGGYNLANEYFNYTNPYGQWKDTGIRLEGDAVQSLTATFLEMWNAANDRNNNEDFSKYFIRSEYKAAQNGFVQPYADSPMDDEQVGEEVYISMVNKAEKYCWFITPYLIITDEMTHALCLAAKRGIDVRIITPGIPDKKMIYSVTRSFYHGLVKNGVRIYEWTPGFCHAKMSVADDCMATCGTINLDYRSLYHHFENGCFMADSPAVLSIRNDLEKTMKECREVTEQYRTGRSAYLRLGQLFMRLFAGLL